MKYSFILIALCLFQIQCLPQDYPDFGIPSSEDLAYKECNFEKEAGAVILIHEAFSYSDNDEDLITTHHFKIKVLKQSGVQAANISIPFYRINYFETISKLEAITINVSEEGKIIKQIVSKKSIFNKKINNYISAVSFAFPSVKVGSIIEYQYESKMQNYFGLRDWYFQTSIPVLISRYHLKTIFTKKFAFKVFKNSDAIYSESVEKDRAFFEMQHIPSLPSEPFMDAKDDYLQRVNFHVGNFNSRFGSTQVSSYQQSWKALNWQMLMRKSFGQQIYNTVEKAKFLTDSVKLFKSDFSKMSAIYNYVQQHFIWDKIDDLFSDELNAVWKNEKGSTGDLNMLLINLLNKVDVKAYPLLVSQREFGKVDTSYANIQQFNSLYCCVIISGRYYILNVADKDYPIDIYPESVLNTTAFLIDRIEGELLKIETDNEIYRKVINQTLEINEAGRVTGKVEINDFDYAKIDNYNAGKKDSASLQENYLKQKELVLKINNFIIQKSDATPRLLTEKFEIESNLNGNSKYKYLPVNLFTEFTQNPFISNSRFTDINFGYKKSVEINLSVKLPANFLPEALPSKLLPDSSNYEYYLTRIAVYDSQKNSIEFHLKIEINKSYFEVKDYQKLKSIYKNIFNILEEQIVIRQQ